MTVKEGEKMIEELKKDGWNEEEIVAGFYQLFIEDEININELEDLVSLVGYELTEEFKKMSPEDQKTKGWADEDDDKEYEEECNELTEECIKSCVIEIIFPESPPKKITGKEKFVVPYTKIIKFLKDNGYSKEEIITLIIELFYDKKINFSILQGFLKKYKIEIDEKARFLSLIDFKNYIFYDFWQYSFEDFLRNSRTSCSGRFVDIFNNPRPKMPVPELLKYETFIRNKINVGDLYLAKYQDEVLLLKVKKKGDQLDPYFHLSYVNMSKYLNQFLENKSQLTILDEDITKEIQNYKYTKKQENIIFELLFRNGFYVNNEIRLYPEYGLFKQNIFNGKIVNIPDIINTHDYIIGREEISFFETYFKCVIHEEGSLELSNEEEKVIYFRKIEDNISSIFQTLALNNKLLVDASDLNCGILFPYRFLDNLDYMYTSEGGYSYNFKDIFKFISKKLNVGKRNTNANIVIHEFSEFYQRGHNIVFKGFSSSEIINILDTYFALDVVQGYYYSHDTIIETPNKIIMYDREWLEVFYNTIKNYNKKKMSIYKMSDIVPYKRLIAFFKIYTFNRDDFPHYFNMAHQSETFEEFIERVEKVLIHQSQYRV